ncbi:MAG TPA: hypothetical protein VFL46_09390 [Phycicoccus sp.]|nr:hypothetical protein [Phycicoccus sp.]
METQSWQFLAKIGGIPPRAWSAIAPRGRVHPGVVDRLSDAVAADARALAPHESVVGARLLQVLVSTARTRGRGADAEAGASALLADIDAWCGTGWPKRWPPPNPPLGWDESMVFAGGALAAAQLAGSYADVPAMREALGRAADRLAARAVAA